MAALYQPLQSTMFDDEEAKNRLLGMQKAREISSTHNLTNTTGPQPTTQDMLKGGAGILASTQNSTDPASGVGQGMLAGAATGTPVGMAVGGAVGGIAGALNARENRKARQRQATANMEQNKALIAQNEGAMANNAIQSIVMGLRDAMLRGR
jgi:hypothetical protein